MAFNIVQKVLSKTGRRILLLSAGGITAGTTIFALNQPLDASDLIAHPVKMDWYHNSFYHSFDHASIRRGWEVYKQVCAACHSLKYIHYRDMVDVFLTEEEAKREAEDVLVEDGPDDTGKMFTRPGKLSDTVPSPYPNEEAARAANNGAYPPDLSLMTIAREGGEDYVFSLLLGYTDPPAGYNMEDGQHFNAYFPDGAIGMAQALYDEVIEYSDGTPATASQMAKDVSTFLAWTAQPEHDERKYIAIKISLILVPVTLLLWIWKRKVWIQLKTRKIAQRK